MFGFDPETVIADEIRAGAQGSTVWIGPAFISVLENSTYDAVSSSEQI